jgi:hypothetical protein
MSWKEHMRVVMKFRFMAFTIVAMRGSVDLPLGI